MKIQCDVCNKDEASVYCVADEAALCDGCDHRVHHANKLARKHQRFSLLVPSPNQYPICDICQEKKAFLFCQQDRAILCKDCDIPIHKANEHTKNHNRFLLTGIKLSPTCAIYTASHQEEEHDLVPDFNKSQSFINKPVSGVDKFTNPQLVVGRGDCNESVSSISEYLMENIPGWHVEDFLDSSNSTPFNAFCKTSENDMLPFWDDDLEGNLNSFSTENMGIWVPQAPPEMQPSPLYPASNIGFGGQICFQEPKETKITTNIKTIRKRRNTDGGFTVPEMNPPSMFSKRSRTLLL
ncbi:B-box zinc finger protein 21 [Heracleum sosnowskyi]|uniref:B-box zinc finger protein 21 n=1 Tax=Heracleum sosnowskyi TaxID=360622 RepID=A0AAD8IUX0_9APIA|nr:B-box zinc finger protein 21 [Heracleum sosnowskyi]